MKSIFTIILLIIPNIAHACSVCFYGSPDDPMNVGVNMAIIGLVAILVFLMVFFVMFFLNFRKRSRAMQEI